jgi:monoamine oxidase
MDWLSHQILQKGGRVKLQCPVREVRWRRGRVQVSGDGFRFAARQCVVTLPLGVLQSGAVRFFPDLEKQKALRSLASGPVIKAALRFPSAFWEKRYRGVAFFHAPRAPFPTFWTPLPARVPQLIAWSGGPKADALENEDPVAAALGSLKMMFGKFHEPDELIIQDWARDPFARGAYSYVRVDGEGAREKLAQPLADTLFFAGEATSVDDSGTVAGALASGQRAAAELLTSAIPRYRSRGSRRWRP